MEVGHTPGTIPELESRRGYTLLELLVVMSVVGILTGIAAINVTNLRQPADEAARSLSSTLGFSRARAIATTSAVRVQRAAGTRTYRVASAPSCAAASAAWTELTAQAYTLPADVTTSGAAAAWSACFSSRGMVDGAAAPAVTFTDRRARTRSLQVYAGGAVVIQ